MVMLEDDELVEDDEQDELGGEGVRRNNGPLVICTAGVRILAATLLAAALRASSGGVLGR